MAVNRIAISQAGDFIVKPGWSLGPRATPPNYELVFFPYPTATRYENDRENRILCEPCFVVTRPFERHKYIFDPDRSTRHLFFHFLIGPEELPFKFLKASGASIFPSETNPLLKVMINHVMRLAHSVNEQKLCILQGERLLIALLGELDLLDRQEKNNVKLKGESVAACEYKFPSELRKALQYMDQNLERRISIPDIAAHVGWSHEHLARMCTKHLGNSPTRELLIRRMERACLLLTTEFFTIQEVATAVGFGDALYFSRCFSRIKGMNATAYRERYTDPRMHHISFNEIPQDIPYPINTYVNI